MAHNYGPYRSHPYTSQEDATEKMLSDAMRWPYLVLPMENKRFKDEAGFPKLGVVLAPWVKGKPLLIYLGSMFDKDLTERPQEVYASPQAAMDAGWRVN